MQVICKAHLPGQGGGHDNDNNGDDHDDDNGGDHDDNDVMSR